MVLSSSISMAVQKTEREFRHRWDLSPEEAISLQRKLAQEVVKKGQIEAQTVAGIDVSFPGEVSRAAVVILSYPTLELVDYAVAARPITWPYVPGLLSFREGPVILEALDRLAVWPDLLIFDGHGLAHPRRLGLASHIGLLVNLPSIGCAKARLCGRHETPGIKRGSYTFLMEGKETIGAVVRTRSRVKPVFVSIGHRVDLATSIEYVLGCCRGYRLPETTRRAHRLAKGEIPAKG